MSARQIFSIGLASLLAAAVAGSFQPAHAGSVSYEIKFDTSSLVPGPGGLIDIALNPAFAESPATVSVDVFNPTTDGTLGAATPISGTATGDLTTPAGVTANNSTLQNELTQDFTVKTFFDVFVTLSGPEVGSGAVGPFSGTVFSLTIFDSGTGMEGATLTVNPNIGPNGMPIVDGTVGISTTGQQVMVIPVGPVVPEPSSMVLMGLGGVALVTIGRSRSKRAVA
jgi:hypothetical protein